MKCIDTHIHIWNFGRARYSWLEGDTSILNRNYLITELEPQIENAGVTEGVLVQAANTIEETDYMLEVASQTSWLIGVVGWLPLKNPTETAEILETGYARHPLFKGMRHLVHDEPDTKWLLQHSVIDSLQLLANHDIPFDVVGVLPEHLETVLKLIDFVPELRFVLDHLNQPPIKTGEKFGRWGELIEKLAEHPNAYAKISGLGTTTGRGDIWGEEDIKPYVAFALQNFGSERCFCGGDWPVSLLAGTYEHAWKTYQSTLSSILDEAEVENVLYNNAKAFYRL